MREERSAGAVVFRREGKKIKYLILHYESGHWDFPRGHIEIGEKELETARREIMEETGIDELEFIPGFRSVTDWHFKQDIDEENVLIHKTAILFLAETKMRKVVISHEHIGSLWLTYYKALEKLTFDNAKNILKEANEFLAEGSVKKQKSK